MAVGAYRHRVGVLNPSGIVDDGRGGYVTGYTPADPPEVDASITAASARDLERATAGTVIGTATHLVRCRFHPAITLATRLVFEGRTFEVQSAHNLDERDVAMVLVCAELLAADGAPVRVGGPTPPTRREPLSNRGL